MTTEKLSIPKLHKKYVKNSSKCAIVSEKSILICNLTFAVQEYDFLLRFLPTIVKYPDKVYVNKSAKRGSKCLIKKIEGILLFTTIEEEEMEEKGNYLVTAFKIEERYLKGYKQIWSWEGGDLHRNTLDATN